MTPNPSDLAPFDLVIFDWDGTLFDSIGQIVASLQYAASLYDIDLPAHKARNIIGLGLPEAMQVLFPQHVDLQPKIQADYSKHYVAHSYTQHWFSGVDDLLQQLLARNVQLAVATGKSRAGLDRVLLQTDSTHLFCITRSASETCSKPDPLMLTQILQETGIALERTVMVGDTTYDLEMAQRIGMPSIGVSYGVHNEAQLAQFEPIAIVHSIAELSAVLLSSSALA